MVTKRFSRKLADVRRGKPESGRSLFSLVKFIRRFVPLVSVLGLMLGGVGRAEAGYLFMIDDRGPGAITVSNTGSTLPGSVLLLPDSTADFVHFSYQIENGVVNPVAPATFSVSRDLLDPLSSSTPLSLSDRLVVKFTLDSPTVEVWFDSRMPVVLPVGDVIGGTPVVEVDDGNFVFLLGYGFLDTDTGQSAAAEFWAASEPHESVPESASLTLFGIGLASVVAMRRRRDYSR
jgi:hypothetical protein